MHALGGCEFYAGFYLTQKPGLNNTRHTVRAVIPVSSSHCKLLSLNPGYAPSFSLKKSKDHK